MIRFVQHLHGEHRQKKMDSLPIGEDEKMEIYKKIETPLQDHEGQSKFGKMWVEHDAACMKRKKNWFNTPVGWRFRCNCKRTYLPNPGKEWKKIHKLTLTRPSNPQRVED